MKLEDIATCYTGAVLRRYEGDVTYPLLSAKFVDDIGDICGTEVFHGFQVPGKYLLREGDLAMKIATPNTTVYISEQWQGTLISSYHFLIRLRKEAEVDARFLAAYFNSRLFRNAVERELVFSTVQALKISILKKMEIPILPMEKQQKVIDITMARRQEWITRRILQDKQEDYVEHKLAELFRRG